MYVDQVPVSFDKPFRDTMWYFCTGSRIEHNALSVASEVGDQACITWPPSTLIVWPVTCAALAEDRKITMSAMSSGFCQLPSALMDRTFSPPVVVGPAVGLRLLIVPRLPDALVERCPHHARAHNVDANAVLP